MKLLRTLVLFVALVFAANVYALDVGDEAPNAEVSSWVMNAPENYESGMKGRVTFIELWGVN